MAENRESLGEAAGDCLKAVYKLRTAGGRVSTSALAGELGVAEPTVTAMVKRLARLGLLYHAPYRGVELTPAGEKVALEIVRHHRLLELYLVEALGVSWEKVHAEAERLEHVLSEELEDRIDAVLGHPTVDPHGDPIPTKEGRMEPSSLRRLADLEAGEAATVRRVPDGNPELLNYLSGLGLVPNARVRVVEKAPFGGPLTVEIGESRHAVGRDLAGAIRTDPGGPEPLLGGDVAEPEAVRCDPAGKGDPGGDIDCPRPRAGLEG